MTQIRKLSQDGQVFAPATTTDAVVDANLQVAASKLIEEINVSKVFPNGGIDGTNKYTLETAIAKIPSAYRNVGIKCSFLNEAGEVVSYIYQGGTFTDTNQWRGPNVSRSEMSETIAKETSDVKSRTKNIHDGGEDEFIFGDMEGNVIAKIGNKGVSSKNFLIVDSKGESVGVINEAFLKKLNTGGEISDIYNSKTDQFIFSDNKGNVIAIIDRDGFRAKKYMTENNRDVSKAYIHPLNGKRVWSFGDSHQGVDNANTILSVLEEKTGCVVDKTLNTQCGIAFTGNTNSDIYKKYEYSIDTNQRSLHALKDMVSDQRTSEPDVIFLEQTHPTFADTIDAEPFIGTKLIEYNSLSSPFASKTDMQNNLETDVLDYIKNISPKNRIAGTVLKMYYQTLKKVITFSAPSSLTEGSFILNIGDQSFSAEVTAGMTLSEALSALNEWQFGDTSDWANENPHAQITENKLTILYKGESADAVSTNISVTDNNTGISLDNVEDSSVSNHGYLLFMLHDPAKWEIFSSWKYNDNNTDYDYGYAMLKGTIELAQTLFPKARIVLWYPNSYALLENSVVRYADGTLDISETQKRNTWTNWELNNRDAWKACAELYSCRFIDVSRNSTISYINYDTWYKAEIHPTSEGYARWGEVIAELY